ncbi:MAG: radical SAM protein [Nanoarchaeota archaeon]|nr:radical SAM protein [Nanoarchaeota archaeon]|tara:strand:- start:557 stop:2017 length:1461 start_codon:yes stop_codon:yes gene_type:complete
MYTILDCYTDEAAGLGVPPYLGTYPRYIAGYLKGKVNYLTIDDLRLHKKYDGNVKEIKLRDKSQISTYNLTKNNVGKILDKTKILIVIVGVHVPGKYLSAIPGTLKEVVPLIKDLKCFKILTGPAIFGNQLFGGKLSEEIEDNIFDEVSANFYRFGYEEVDKISVKGAKKIFSQIKEPRVIEIETGRGCDIGKCSFCLEPIKNRVEFRDKENVLKEIEEFYNLGARYFRLGKQTCFYTYPEAVSLLENINKKFKKIKVLHIDNVNPVKVLMDKDHKITKAIVKYCTSGNIAAFGVESFDAKVVKENTLNTSPEVAMKAIEIINKYGREIGEDGLPKFLPGINIIFGLIGESKKTHKANMKYLDKILRSNLLLRRINIRQAAVFKGTSLMEKAGNKFLRKNKKHYWKWRNEIRNKIDNEMLKKVVPVNTILNDCYAEIYDGNKTFLRQFGTYPLVVGVEGRIKLKEFYNVKIKEHMQRGLGGEICSI